MVKCGHWATGLIVKQVCFAKNTSHWRLVVVGWLSFFLLKLSEYLISFLLHKLVELIEMAFLFKFGN